MANKHKIYCEYYNIVVLILVTPSMYTHNPSTMSPVLSLAEYVSIIDNITIYVIFLP